MNAAAWTQVLSALGALVAAGVAAYSANLAWRQLHLQFQPRLLVGNAHFQIRMMRDSLQALWWEPPSEEARYINGGETEYLLKLVNIGRGPAYEVQIRTEFDYESVFEDLKEKLAPFVTGLDLQYDDWGCQVSVHGALRGGFRLPDEAFAVVEHIEGATSGRQTATFPIDPSLSFFALCYAYFLMKGHTSHASAQEDQRIEVTFAIEYTNQAGKRLKERHRRELVITGGRWRADLSDGVAIIYLLNPEVRQDAP